MDAYYSAQNRKFLLPLIYMIPSYLLYALILYAIIFSSSKSKFIASFYRLFSISAGVYILTSIAYYVNMRLPKTPILIPFVQSWPTRHFILTIMQILPTYFSCCMHLFNLFLSFNRLSIFVLRADYQVVWDRYFKFIVVFGFAFPLLCVWHIPFSDIQLGDNDDGTRYITEGNKESIPWMNKERNNALLGAVTSTLSFFMNIFVIFKILQQKITKAKSKTISRHDIQMCFYSLMIYVTEVVFSISMFLLITAPDLTFRFAVFDVQYFLYDICTLSPAWFILLTNKPIRREITRWVFNTKNDSITTISMSNAKPVISRVIT